MADDENPADEVAYDQLPEHLSDDMLKWFEYRHLPEHLRGISKPFSDLARHICVLLDRGPERDMALRKLLEAKDAAVRARVHPGG